MTPAPHPQYETGYWLTPPDIFKKLNDEFNFDFDPCPYPLPEGYNGIIKEWGRSSFVNPPFHKKNGIGPTAFMRKAIAENKKGKTVVLIAPTQSYVNFMLEAGAELRSMGRIRWLHGETKEPCKDPSPITAFILRGRTSHSFHQSEREKVLDELDRDIPIYLSENPEGTIRDFIDFLLLEFRKLRQQGKREVQ